MRCAAMPVNDCCSRSRSRNIKYVNTASLLPALLVDVEPCFGPLDSKLTSRPGCSTGSACRRNWLNNEKIAALAPMPSARDRMATDVTKGVLNSVRRASRRGRRGATPWTGGIVPWLASQGTGRLRMTSGSPCRPVRQCRDRGIPLAQRPRMLWTEDVRLPPGRRIRHDDQADVCVVGAGIAGLTTAYLLGREGRSVVLLDEGGIAGGTTTVTTAHLSNVVDAGYAEIGRLHGRRGAQLPADSHSAAIDGIERILHDEAIACDFERL